VTDRPQTTTTGARELLIEEARQRQRRRSRRRTIVLAAAVILTGLGFGINWLVQGGRSVQATPPTPTAVGPDGKPG
jgi:hypothetical protein